MNGRRIRSTARQTASVVVCGVILAGVSALQGQSTPAPKQETPAAKQEAPAPEREKKKGFYKQHVAIGATASGMILDLFKDTTVTSTITSPATTTFSTLQSKASRVGGGLTMELTITPKISFTANALYHHIGYTTDTEIDTGTTTITTTSSTETTSARYWDVPILFRFAPFISENGRSKFFVQAGGAARFMSKVRTSISHIDSAGTSTCCDTAPARPAHKMVRGLVAGFGVRAVDDFGIKVIPEVRYTRWLANTFGPLPAQSNRQQVEVLLGIAF